MSAIRPMPFERKGCPICEWHMAHRSVPDSTPSYLPHWYSAPEMAVQGWPLYVTDQHAHDAVLVDRHGHAWWIPLVPDGAEQVRPTRWPMPKIEPMRGLMRRKQWYWLLGLIDS